MTSSLPNPKDAVAVFLEGLNRVPNEHRVRVCTGAITKVLGDGDYATGAALAREGEVPETAVYNIVMGFAALRGDDPGMVFELVYGFGTS